jgi:hypothetical protein
MSSNPLLKHGRSSRTACIEVAGSGAAAFLHAQLSQRIEGIEPGTAPLAAWSDARGRARAVFRVVGAADAWLVLTHAERAAAVVEQLSRYVLRAKVTLRVAPELEVHALVGGASAWLAARDLALPAEPGSTVARAGAHWIRLGPELVEAVLTADHAAGLGAALDTASDDDIELGEIRLGLPSLAPGLEERYVPQMLNLDRLDAIAFDKGCYPGQEVIARTQNLGAVKRRMRRFALTGAVPAIGAALVDDGGEPIGEVIRAAPSGAGAEVLAVVRLDLLDRPIVLAGDTDVRLTALDLPYAT